MTRRPRTSSTVTIADRTPRTDADSRELLRTSVRELDSVTITLAPRVYLRDGNKLLPGNSHKFRFGTKAEAVEWLRRVRMFAEAEKERVEGRG